MKQFSLEEYLKNPSRKVITRDGEKARIICTDAKNDYPIVALIETPNGKERLPCGYKKDGTYITGEKLSCDLFFVTEKHEGWVNIFKGTIDDYFIGDSRVFKSKEDAEKAEKEWSSYVTVKIEWEE